MPLNIATSLEILEEHVPIPSSPDAPQISRRSRRLQHAARNDRPELETREPNSSRKRHRGESQERNDGTNKLARVCCTEGVSCEWAKLAMLQGKMISNLMSRVSVLEERIGMYDLPQAIPRIQHLNSAEHASNSLHSRKYVCPVDNCGKSFKRSDNLSRHIMDTKSSEHMEVARNLNQTYCVPCQKDFKRPSDFTRHEKNNHKEMYKARLEWVENGPVDGYVTRMPSESTHIRLRVTFSSTEVHIHFHVKALN
ncbi:hypothetical protein BJ878DRAFT_140209 [Calycina marina]|uniref:C2H2-type domain-containing protein n=1 Tax=Calycina marina TaxID=1763456 RepID=A0A9P7ZA60_9HELO|nr:hypothetical protein BJ878DRAFT_140209 [Calycina marina]